MSVHVIPGEFSPFTIAIAILSGFIVFFGYVSMFIKERCFLSEAFVALIVGIIAGPLVANGFNPYSWNDTDEITKEFTRCVIAIQVMAVGIELPKYYLWNEWRSMFFLLIPVMLFMWLISGLFIWWLIPPINYLQSLVIAACVCPTDPILANSVVKGRFAEKHVPTHIRNVLSAESGANDGMGFPFLYLAIFLLNESSVGEAIGKWIYITWLFQIALSCVIGVVAGWLARKVLQWSERNHLIDKPSFLCFAIALALFLMSMTGFSGSDDLLACFAAGNAFSWDDWFRQETEEAHFQDVIDTMLNSAMFVYIGTIIPWSEFGNTAIGLEPWRLVVIALLILLFRRLPIVLILKPVIPAMKTYREALFSGWFGPMGVGAVFLSTVAKEQLTSVYADEPNPPVAIQLISPVVLFIVLASTLVHGTTIPLFKIGNRIRTRTLSITSTGSSQVLRLPKIQIGQPLSFRRSEDDRRSRTSREIAMTELQRNTLMNTGLPERTADTLDYAVDVHGDHDSIGSDNDEIAEVDFLPESDDPQHLPPHLPESQSIRFLEPVKPRNYTPANVNVEKNEASVSSFRSWRNRHTKDDDSVDDTHANSLPPNHPLSSTVSNSGSEHDNTGPSSGGSAGLLSLFRRKKDATDKGLATAEDVSTDSHHHQIQAEAWEADHHVTSTNSHGAAVPTLMEASSSDVSLHDTNVSNG